jgi:hypothetical protein
MFDREQLAEDNPPILFFVAPTTSHSRYNTGRGTFMKTMSRTLWVLVPSLAILAALQRTCKVGSYEPNRLGLYDMHGNVWEWCHDWYDKDYYRNSPKQDPKGPEVNTASRVLRGGSWIVSGQDCRAANRKKELPGLALFAYGFRVVCRLDVKTP